MREWGGCGPWKKSPNARFNYSINLPVRGSFITPSQAAWLRHLPALFEISALDPARLRRRIKLMERNLVLPVKATFIAMIWFSFFRDQPWVGQISSTLDVTVEEVQYIFWFYMAASFLMMVVVMVSDRLPLAAVQWSVVACSMVDGLFIAGMALITGGLDSLLFWLLVGLIVRNSVSVPPGFSQLFLNGFISLCYIFVAVLNVSVISNLDDTTLRIFDMTPNEELGEPFFLRLIVLWLTAACGYGSQAFLEKQRVAVEEAAEFASREGQLRSAGRLAAEFTHQIKNPLAIINNAAFSLQRALREGKAPSREQIEIILEEVNRADRVITQVMGYAKLSEGRVEKLDVLAELERALEQVFPPAVPMGIEIRRNFGRGFPPLLMQRSHLSEALVNLLQNAREVLPGGGKIVVAAEWDRDHLVTISVADSGPGIAPELKERIFEAYYTTKEKGTGLGLSIVKHNIELYGGRVMLESELGKGAKFSLFFPAKTSMIINTP
jgi:signal transduction histidine kinase